MVPALAERGTPAQVCRSGDGGIRLAERSVKLVTMHGANGLDFPSVYALAPGARERGWEPERAAECRRLLYVALTRSSERLTLGLVYERHHPLVGALGPAAFEAVGSRGRALANTAGPRA